MQCFFRLHCSARGGVTGVTYTGRGLPLGLAKLSCQMGVANGQMASLFCLWRVHMRLDWLGQSGLGNVHLRSISWTAPSLLL